MTKLFKVVGITLLLNIIVPLICISNLIASEFNSILKGEYVFSTTRICASGPLNLDLSRKVNGSIDMAFIEAIVTFNGDGSGTATWTSILGIKPTQIYAGQYPVRHSSASGTITYEVFGDKTFQVEIRPVSWHVQASGRK